MAKNIILRAKDFKYPTKLELSKIDQDNPQLLPFDLKFKSVIHSILEEKKALPLVHKESLLNEWNRCLLNKLGKLGFSFQSVLTHYNRGFCRLDGKKLKVHHVNRIQFDYYAEIFYYQFYSVVDTIGQIINVYFDLSIPEWQLHFKKLKLKNTTVQQLINAFNKSTEEASKYRNAFTHKFPVNETDYRTSLKTENNRSSLGSGTGYYIKPDILIHNLKEARGNLKLLLDGLREILI
ncbi:Cthe_2314 family HEPN domain-containing protein [Pedobacter sp.]|uniref:Cthe_2314 family HEPN domain-containing protein n=1 Tax=Pedobacter sp. TaxID=1411316 RepID=UPI0031D8DD42